MIDQFLEVIWRPACTSRGGGGSYLTCSRQQGPQQEFGKFVKLPTIVLSWGGMKTSTGQSHQSLSPRKACWTQQHGKWIKVDLVSTLRYPSFLGQLDCIVMCLSCIQEKRKNKSGIKFILPFHLGEMVGREENKRLQHVIKKEGSCPGRRLGKYQCFISIVNHSLGQQKVSAHPLELSHP